MSIREKLADEDGFSLVELLVAMSIGMVVLFGVFAIIDTTQRSSARTISRVSANQTARPVLDRIMDELHSSCISADLAPIQAGSTGESITFIHSNDRGTAPVPTKRTITWVQGTPTSTINETVFPYASGVAPTWQFSATGTTTRLITSVTRATLGDPEVEVPPFRYYAYDTSTATISPTPMVVPASGLTATDAAKVVKVTFSFAFVPNKKFAAADEDATVSFSDSALLRFTPASITGGEGLLPCA